MSGFGRERCLFIIRQHINKNLVKAERPVGSTVVRDTRILLPDTAKSVDANKRIPMPDTAKSVDANTRMPSPAEAQSADANSQIPLPDTAKSVDANTRIPSPAAAQSVDANSQIPLPDTAKSVDVNTQIPSPAAAQSVDANSQIPLPDTAKSVDVNTQIPSSAAAQSVDANTQIPSPDAAKSVDAHIRITLPDASKSVVVTSFKEDRNGTESEVKSNIPCPVSPVDNNGVFAELIKRLDAFNTEDDGIKFNWKYRSLVECFQANSKTPEEFEKNLSAVHKECLNEEKLTEKFVNFICARQTKNIDICGKRFLPEFLKLLQQDFDDRETLIKEDEAFRNLVRLMGEFLVKKKDFPPIEKALLELLAMLLSEPTSENIRLFMDQIYFNGKNLKVMFTSPLLIKVRLVMAKVKLPPKDRARLLLALDLVRDRSSLIKGDLIDLYTDLINSD